MRSRRIVAAVAALSWWIDRTDSMARLIRAQELREFRLFGQSREIVREYVKGAWPREAKTPL